MLRVLNAECDQLMVMARMNVGALRCRVHLRRRRTGFSTMVASNPGAITHLLTCWIEHNNSLDQRGQTIVLGASLNVFDDLDWGALHLKQMFAAEIIRLETESHHPSVQKNVSIILHRFPEIRSLACAASAPDTRAGALRKPPIWT